MTPTSQKAWPASLTVVLGFLLEARVLLSTTGGGCPSACFCDQSYVSCVGDGQRRIPDDLPGSAVRLDVRDFDAVALTESSFLALTDLRELKIQQCRVSSIDGGTFAHVTKMTRLDLSQNRLVSLSSDVFSGLGGLRYADLSSNWLVNISQAFLELVNVEQLILRSNRIGGLDNRSFKGLINVQYLNLDFNEIAWIEPDAFQYMTKLVHLTLGHNPIKSLHRLDFFSDRLQYIDVSRSGLQRVPQSLTRFVRDLRLGKNNITRISAGDFDSYPYLGFLVLDDNRISEVEADALGRQDYLLRLWLNGNQLSCVPADLPPSLRTLHLDDNRLAALPPFSFRGLAALEHLFLPGNSIGNISQCAFCDLLSLRSLDLRSNLIEHLHQGAFANLTRLETLDLSANRLKRLEAFCLDSLPELRTLHLSRVYTAVVLDKNVFQNLTALRSLELYDSAQLVLRIFSSTRILQSLQSVQEINIMHNKLVRLRPDLASFFPHLKMIKLSDNEWDCSSPRVLWLTNWLRSSQTHFFRSQTILCSTPDRFHSVPVRSLTEQDFATDNETMANLTTPSESFDNFTKELLNDTATLRLVPQKLETFRTDASYSVATTATVKTSDIAVIVDDQEKGSDRALLATTPLSTFTLSNPRHPVREEVQPSSHPSATSGAEEEDGRAKKRPLGDAHFQMLVAGAPEPSAGPPPRWDRLAAVTVAASLAGGCLVLLASSALLLAICRFRVRLPRKRRGFSTRRSNSITYYPQQDEVAILTVSESTVG